MLLCSIQNVTSAQNSILSLFCTHVAREVAMFEINKANGDFPVGFDKVKYLDFMVKRWIRSAVVARHHGNGFGLSGSSETADKILAVSRTQLRSGIRILYG